eukprot:TRINITY_DN5061_c0_g1_i1.p1 TRINITY_DN5061_c0_g1~~TRINITY_DN5061_c0_g1_i1.p1  ORF type:complete len:298 (-),score=57.75 TRINITY_DN5061_c0_g1_i1:385-1278(-)
MWRVSSSVLLSKENDEIGLSLFPKSLESLVACPTSNHVIKLLDVETCKLTRSLSGHTKKVTGVCWGTGDSPTLFSSSLDGTVKIWDLREYKVVKTLSNCNEEPAFAGYFCVAANEGLVCAGTKKTAHCWKLPSGVKSDYLDDLTVEDVEQLFFHPREKDHLYIGSSDGLISIYDLSNLDPDDAFIDALNTEQAIQQMNIYGTRDDLLWCCATIEALSLWDLKNQEKPLIASWKQDFRDKLSELSSHQIFNFLNCYYHIQKEQLFMFAGTQCGTISIFGIEGSCIEHVMSLSGAHKGM